MELSLYGVFGVLWYGRNIMFATDGERHIQSAVGVGGVDTKAYMK